MVPSVGDQYEIQSLFNASQIHKQINKAIEQGHPSFWDHKDVAELVVQEDTLEYDLSDLTTTPWRIRAIFMERNSSVQRGVVDSVTNNTFTDADADFSNVVDGTTIVTIYDGTGKGQIRTISSTSGTTATISVKLRRQPGT